MARPRRSTGKSRPSTASTRQSGPFKTVEIGHRRLRVAISTLNVLFEWMAERDRIRKKRFAGEPAPWTEDPILKTFKFCHVFRIFDRGSQFLLHNVINQGSQEHREVCFRVLLFKFFNRASTWEVLQEELGPLTWAAFDLDAYERVLTSTIEENPVYTAAYQIPAPKLVDGPAYKNHLIVLQMMMENDLPGKLLSCHRMQDAHELIKLYPGMGQFLSYQMVLDLNMTPEINYPENEWAVCGPGSLNCLGRIFGPGVRGVETEAIEYLYRTQMKHYARLGILDPPGISASRLGISFVDIEHSLCECSKYLRYRDQKGKGTWMASAEALTSDLPAKWDQEMAAAPEDHVVEATFPLSVVAKMDTEQGQGQDQEEDEDEDEDMDEDTYEVSHIVKERQVGASGSLEYRVRWTGYGPNDDTWMSEAELCNAPELLTKWRSRQVLEDEGEGEDEEDNTYEVSHIFRERQMSPSGPLEYRVRWKGYGPDEDTWMSEGELCDAPELLKEWRLRRGLEDKVNHQVAKIRSSDTGSKVSPSPNRTLRVRSD